MRKLILFALIITLNYSNANAAYIVRCTDDSFAPSSVYVLCEGDSNFPPGVTNPNPEQYNALQITTSAALSARTTSTPGCCGWYQDCIEITSRFTYKTEDWDGISNFRQYAIAMTLLWIYDENACQSDYEPECVNYVMLEQAFDSTGQQVYAKVGCFDIDGNFKDVYHYGDKTQGLRIKSGLEEGYYNTQSYYDGILDDSTNDMHGNWGNLSDVLNRDINGDIQGDLPLPLSMQESETVPPPPDENEVGTTDPGSDITTDVLDYTDQFSAMIENQGKQIQNQSNDRELQETQNTLLGKIETAIKDISAFGGIVGDMPSADEIGQAVKNNMETWIDTEINGGEGTLTGLGDGTDATKQGELEGVAGFDGTETEFSQIREDVASGYRGIYDTFISSNPLLAAFQSHSLTTSGATSCISFNAGIMGEHTACFDQFASIFDMCGNFAVWLATFAGFAIVLK